MRRRGWSCATIPGGRAGELLAAAVLCVLAGIDAVDDAREKLAAGELDGRLYEEPGDVPLRGLHGGHAAILLVCAEYGRRPARRRARGLRYADHLDVAIAGAAGRDVFEQGDVEEDRQQQKEEHGLLLIGLSAAAGSLGRRVAASVSMADGRSVGGVVGQAAHGGVRANAGRIRGIRSAGRAVASFEPNATKNNKNTR